MTKKKDILAMHCRVLASMLYMILLQRSALPSQPEKSDKVQKKKSSLSKVMPVTLLTKAGRPWGQDQPELHRKALAQRKGNHFESRRELLRQQEPEELIFLHVRLRTREGN